MLSERGIAIKIMGRVKDEVLEKIYRKVKKMVKKDYPRLFVDTDGVDDLNVISI